MSNLVNPFSPYITALTSAHEGHSSVHGAGSHTTGSIDMHGNTQHLHDEIGRHIGTVDHLTHGSATFHSASGATVGSAHTVGHTTEISDGHGAHVAAIHHGATHDTIEHAHHELPQTVDHQGHTDVYHDVHGVHQTVHHI